MFSEIKQIIETTSKILKSFQASKSLQKQIKEFIHLINCSQMKLRVERLV